MTYDESPAEYEKEPESRVGDLLEFNRYLIGPTMIRSSKYHKLLAKELSISQLKRDDVMLIQIDYELINLFVFLDVPEMAHVYQSEMLVRINSLRSIDGFERIQQTSSRQVFKAEGDLEKTLGKFYQKPQGGT